MSIPVLGIPYLNRPDLLERCVKSIDFPVDKLIIIDNSNGGLCRGSFTLPFAVPPLVRDYLVIAHPNAGVAGSWNEIIMMFAAPWWCLCNNDIAFAPGDLERMSAAADERGHRVACFYANHGASFWIVTEYGITNVSLFDFNLHPAYTEDCDWSTRCDLLGVTRENVQGCKSIHGDDKLTGSCAVNSDPKFRENNVRTHGNNLRYYEQKWGGTPGLEKFRHPFNNPNLPIDYIKYDPAFRRMQQWK